MTVDTRAIQLRELDIMKEIDALCKRHGLRYVAVYGTCLGAVRHHGPIPWDDDMDIGMLREDYEKFRQIAPKELPEHLALMDYDKIRHMPHMFLKVHDVRTAYIGKYGNQYTDNYMGVFVDIFPLDGCPEGIAQTWWKLRMRVLRRLNWTIRTYSRKKTLPEKAFWCVAQALRRVFPYNWASRRAEKLAKSYPVAGSAALVELNFQIFYPARLLASAVDLPYEDMMLPCPAEYDEYLTLEYGDYMQLPPEEARRPHETVYCSLEHSFRELIDENGNSKLHIEEK